MTTAPQGTRQSRRASIARSRARWGEARAARPREGGRARPPLKAKRYQTIQIIRGIQGKMPGQ